MCYEYYYMRACITEVWINDSLYNNNYYNNTKQHVLSIAYHLCMYGIRINIIPKHCFDIELSIMVEIPFQVADHHFSRP